MSAEQEKIPHEQLRQWMARNTGSHVGMRVQNVRDGRWEPLEGQVAVDNEGIMCLLIDGQLHHVPCQPYEFAEPRVIKVSKRQVSPEQRAGSDFADYFGEHEEEATAQRSQLRSEAAAREVEARSQRETLLAESQRQATEASQDRASREAIASRQRETLREEATQREIEAKAQREYLLEQVATLDAKAAQHREMLRAEAVQREFEAKGQREHLLAQLNLVDSTAGQQRDRLAQEAILQATTATQHRERIRTESAEREGVAWSQRSQLQKGQEALHAELISASEERKSLRESMELMVTTLMAMRNSPELLRSPSVVQPTFTRSAPTQSLQQPSPEPDYLAGHIQAGNPLGRCDSTEQQQGSRRNPFVISPSVGLAQTHLSITDEILLARERSTWTSHAIPSSDIIFGGVEKEILKRMPEYVFLKDDPNFAVGRRALRFLTEKIGRHNTIGTPAFMEELAQQLTQQGRALRPSQVAELQVLTSVEVAALSFAGVALAEYAILANPLLPVTAFEQMRLARITRPQNAAEVTSWNAGALMETRLVQLPVRMARDNTGRGRGSGPAQSGQDRGRGTAQFPARQHQQPQQQVPKNK